MKPSDTGSTTNNEGDEDSGKKTKWILTLKASKKVLSDNSRVFKVQIMSNFKEMTATTIELETDNVEAMLLWFRLLHGHNVSNTVGAPIEDLWTIVALADEREFDLKKLFPWFQSWYRANATKYKARQLLYPCFIFDHPEGFAKATKSLVYGYVGHIHEENPTYYEHLRLEGLTIGEYISSQIYSRLTRVLQETSTVQRVVFEQSSNATSSSL